jgi:hypothetical protein
MTAFLQHAPLAARFATPGRVGDYAADPRISREYDKPVTAEAPSDRRRSGRGGQSTHPKRPAIDGNGSAAGGLRSAA